MAWLRCTGSEGRRSRESDPYFYPDPYFWPTISPGKDRYRFLQPPCAAVVCAEPFALLQVPKVWAYSAAMYVSKRGLREVRIVSSRPTTCDKPPHCVNCEGDHPANDNKCPTFLREREIQKIRVTEKVSFPEAKRRFQTRNPVDLSRSFSSAVKPKSPGVTASCQTHCTPAVVSHFSCQVSPVDFPEDSACIQGGKIIIPQSTKNLSRNSTRHRPPQLKLLLKSILSRHRLQEKYVIQIPSSSFCFRESHRTISSSCRSRSPVAKSREIPPTQTTLSSSSQDDSAGDEEPHESSSKTFQKVRKKKKQPKK